MSYESEFYSDGLLFVRNVFYYRYFPPFNDTLCSSLSLSLSFEILFCTVGISFSTYIIFLPPIFSIYISYLSRIIDRENIF